MKSHARKLTAALLAFAMTVSSITPTALAAPGNATGSNDNVVSAGESDSLSSTAETNLASAKIIASLEDSGEDAGKSGRESTAKEAVEDAIFNSYNDTADLSDYNISSDEMDSATEEVLEENNMTSLVDVTYETDSDGNVTTADVEMDAMVAMAAEELDNSKAYNLTEEQSKNLLGAYAQYVGLLEANADIYGVQLPFNTTKDTNSSPIGSLLDVAGISDEDAQGDYDTLYGVVNLFCISTMASIDGYGDTIRKARDEALATIDGSMSAVEKYLALNDWMANNCQFAMDYIMNDMRAPEPKDSELYTYAYNYMYEMIKGQVKQGVIDAMQPYVDAGYYTDAQVEEMAAAQAESYMTTIPDDGSGSGAQQAATTASSIAGLWLGNQVGVFAAKKAVCLGYASAYAYLVQCAFPEIYLKDGKTDLDVADNWKSYEELNYVKDSDGNNKWDASKSEAIIDQVKIVYDADVTMFGQEQPNFDSSHYWNAVKSDGKWYYLDPCYTDIYIECMIRTRVETNGNMNHLYFMFSDDSARELYDGNFDHIDTLYEGIATDKTYEDSWIAFAKSPTYYADNKWYYFYDSTDVLEMKSQYGGFSSQNASLSSSNGVAAAADDNGYGGMMDLFGDTEYKIVYHEAGKDKIADDSYTTLVDITGGQVYNPEKNAMEDNALIKELYDEFTAYAAEYPSIAISAAYYDGKVYFNLADCVLSYDVKTGALTKLIEYTTVNGTRDMSKPLGGLGFTKTSGSSNADITVENPPIAGLTIIGDELYVDVATNYAFISGKTFGDLYDYSSYGYQFAESNYNPSYNSYYNMNDEINDNDEFMWSANIVDTIDMGHLTGSSHNYSTVNVAESCTDDAYKVDVCSTCGLIKEGSSTKVEASAQTANADGDTTDPSDGTGDNNTEDPDPSTEAKAVLNIQIVDEEGVKIASGSLEETGVSGQKYTFKEAAIRDKVDELLPEGYELAGTNTYDDVEVTFGGEAGTFTANAVEKPAEQAEAVLTVEVVDGDKTQLAVSEGALKATGAKGEDCTFYAAEIEAAVEALPLPEGYELPATTEYKDVIVKYGESDTVSFTAVSTAKQDAVATLNVQIVDESNEVIASAATPLTATGAENEEHKFEAAEIEAAVKALTLPEGYELSADTKYEDVTVKYGETKTASFTATKKAEETAVATLNIKIVDKDNNETVVGTGSLVSPEAGTVGAEHSFAAADIETAVKAVQLSEGYVLDDQTYSVVTVAYGASKEEIFTASKPVEKAVATLNVTVYDSADDQSDEDTEPLYTGTITAEGDKGGTHTFTAADIEKALEGKIGDYTLDKDSVKETTAVYGGDAVPVTLTATENVYGHGHTYVKYNETYYTKTDSGDWNTGVCYVCIDCGKTLDEDELEDNMRKTDQNGDEYDKIYDVKDLSGTKTNVWTWSTDGTEAALYQIPQEWKDHRIDCVWENSDISTRTAATVTRGDSANCTSGITYTASANGQTNSKTVKLKAHTYTCEWGEWSEDNSSVSATFTCSVCGDKQTVSATISDQTNPPTCEEDGSTTYTAVAKDSDGQAYSTTKSTVIPATGHDWGDDDICKNCGMKKQESQITLSDKTAVYTGYAIEANKASVTGSTGAITYEYYLDEALEKATTKDNSGADAEKGAPRKAGVYFVKATVKSDGTYQGASCVGKLTITPEKVTGLKVANKEGGVQITWSETAGAQGYRIYRKTADGTVKSIKTVSGGSTVSYTDTGAKSGTLYSYTVKAYGKTTVAAWGTRAGYKKLERLSQPTPKVINANKAVKISWDKVTGADGYIVYRMASTSKKFTKIATIESGSTVSYKDTTAKSGSTYKYTVRAVSGDYLGSYCAGVSIKHLSQPTISVANAEKGIKITWKQVKGADGYLVYRKSGNSGYSRLKKVEGASTLNYVDTTAKAGTTYTYTVKAYSGDQVSYRHSGKSMKRLTQPTPKVANVSSGIKISWSKRSGATGYIVYRKSGNSGYKKIAQIKSASTVSYIDKNVKNGVTYTYTVRAVSGDYLGSYHAGKSIKRVK